MDWKTVHRRQVLARSAAVCSLVLAALLHARGAQAAGPAAAKGAFDAKSMSDVLKALGFSGPAESGEVSISGPDIAENGSVVPFTLATTIANTQRLILLIEKNPNTLAAVFNITPDIEASFSTRVKMAESSQVYAVAVTSDGKVLYAQKEVRVTLGGCGN